MYPAKTERMRGETLIMETFAAIFASKANLERSRREKWMADQPWPIIPSQATEAIRRSISRFSLPLLVLHELESEFDHSAKVCRGHGFTIPRARGPRFVKKILLSSPPTKKREKRERERSVREGKRCVPIILSASVRNIIL